MNLLEKTCANLSNHNTENVPCDYNGKLERMRSIVSRASPASMKFTESFMIRREGKKIQFDTIDPLDAYRYTNLKGKKMANIKKNLLAQTFATRTEGQACLQATRNYFSYFLRDYTPKFMDISYISYKTMEPVENLVFILPCNSYLLSSKGTQQLEDLDYHDRTYIQLKDKKKIFKVPARFTIMFDPTHKSCLVSTADTIIWFTSCMGTISN